MTGHCRDSRQARAGKRWTPDADENLLALARTGNDVTTIARILRRSYSSVQNRLQKFGRIQNAAGLARELHVPPDRSNALYSEMDLTCGAIGNQGYQIVRALWDYIQADNAMTKPREPLTFKKEVQCLIGGIVREAFLCLQEDTWAKVTLSRIRAEESGVNSGVVRNITAALIRGGFLERFVGYRDAVRILNPAAIAGRVTVLRAAEPLINMCRAHDLSAENIFSQFPSLRGSMKDVRE